MPRTAFDLLQRRVHGGRDRPMGVSMPRTAFDLLQQQVNKKWQYICRSFNAAYGI